jgi:hypothetical protein
MGRRLKATDDMRARVREAALLAETTGEGVAQFYVFRTKLPDGAWSRWQVGVMAVRRAACRRPAE